MEAVGPTMVEGNIPLRMVDTMPGAAAHLIVVGNMHRLLAATVMDAISNVEFEWITFGLLRPALNICRVICFPSMQLPMAMKLP